MKRKQSGQNLGTKLLVYIAAFVCFTVAASPAAGQTECGTVSVNGLEMYSEQELGSIQAGVFIMQGDRDVTKPEHAVELYRLIPNSQLLIYPNGDHFILWENPDKVLTDLFDFLTDLP